MKTIEKIIKKSDINLIYLRDRKITNWCGWKWGFNFSLFIKKNIAKFKFFNNSKSNDFFKDLKIVCEIHDRDYYIWENFSDFIKANYTLVVNINLLLNWTWIIRRLLVSIIVFWGTTIFGWKYFINKN